MRSVLRKKLILLILVVCLTISIANAEIQVEKITDSNSYQVGDQIDIYLEITNTDSQDIEVKIEDNNMFGGSGLNIKCLQKTVPANNKIKVEYDPIKLTATGNYTLAKATIRSDNETVESNTLDIEVKGTSQGNYQSVTEIFDCDGRRSTSTSIVAGGMGSINTGMGSINTVPTGPDNQIPLEKDASDYLKDIIDSDNQFIQERKDMLDEGYILQDKEVNATSNVSGTFTYEFKNGEYSRYLQGTIVEGNITSIQQIYDDTDDFIYWIIFIIMIFTILLASYGFWYFTNIESSNIFKHLKDKIASEGEDMKNITYENSDDTDDEIKIDFDKADMLSKDKEYSQAAEILFEGLREIVRSRQGYSDKLFSKVLENSTDDIKSRSDEIKKLREKIFSKEFDNKDYDRLQRIVRDIFDKENHQGDTDED